MLWTSATGNLLIGITILALGAKKKNRLLVLLDAVIGSKR